MTILAAWRLKQRSRGEAERLAIETLGAGATLLATSPGAFAVFRADAQGWRDRHGRGPEAYPDVYEMRAFSNGGELRWLHHRDGTGPAVAIGSGIGGAPIGGTLCPVEYHDTIEARALLWGEVTAVSGGWATTSERRIRPLAVPIDDRDVARGATLVLCSTEYVAVDDHGNCFVTEEPPTHRTGHPMSKTGTLRFIDGQLKLDSPGFRKPKNVKRTNLVGALIEISDEALDGVEVEFDDRGGVSNVRTVGAAKTRRERSAPDASPPPPPLVRRDPGRFLNPYGFVPWVERAQLPAQLRDAAPSGHDRLRPDLYSGTIDIEITATTPLLLLDPEGAPPVEHRVLPLDLDPEGKPRLAASGLKGSLRAAYEAVTGSRFGVFRTEEHATRLAYRMEARDALRAVPARVSNDGARVEPLCGTTPLGEQGANNAFLHAAWLPAYGGDVPKIYGNKVDRTAHGQQYWAVLEPRRKDDSGRSFNYWRVRHLASSKAALPDLDTVGRAPDVGQHIGLRNHALRAAVGRVLWTDQNFGKRHDERFVFADVPASPIALAPLKATWDAVIASYRAAHENSLDRGRGTPPAARHAYLGEKPGKTAWSPHQYDPARQDLRPGQLLYVLYEGRTPKGLIPVTIARQVFDQSPLDQVPADLRPATSLDQLSPADRVFGWVNQAGSGAHRGQLRVSHVTCATPPEHAVRHFDPPLPLAILGQPKPAQGRFYLSAYRERGPARLNDGRDQGAFYTQSTTVRGWKRYWHHADIARSWPEPGTPEAAARYDRATDVTLHPGRDHQRQAADDQNISVKGWVEPNTSFTATIEVRNLNELELGALLWLLDLPGGAHHRLGFAKPLGFGSVRVAVAAGGLRIAPGTGWASYWSDLGASSPPAADAAAPACRQAFEKETESGVLKEPVAAFLRLATGLEVAVLYPRTTNQDRSQDELFKWFAANGRGGKLSLPDATDGDPTLPAL